MRKILKWLGVLALSILALMAVAAGYVYVASEALMARTYDGALIAFRAPSDAATVEKGERLATIYGCTNCHGSQLEGWVMHDEPNLARISAPNVTRIVRQYTDAELERLIRRGIKRNGQSVWVMPAAMFNHMTDEDLGAVMAYVRSVPERDGIDGGITLRALGRIGVAMSMIKPAAVEVDASIQRAAPDYVDPLSLGRYLAMTACSECHGANLQGSEFMKTPSLIIATAYSDADFEKLMRTGEGIGGRKLGLMGDMGPARFSAFTSEEVRALRMFLRTMSSS